MAMIRAARTVSRGVRPVRRLLWGFALLTVALSQAVAGPFQPAAARGGTPRPATDQRTQRMAPSKYYLSAVPKKMGTRYILPGMLEPPSPTKLEVDLYNNSGGEFHNWATERDLNPDPGATTALRFRWQNQSQGIDHVVWQVSLLAYPDQEKDWHSPPGLAASGASKLNPIEIDFASLLHPNPAPAASSGVGSGRRPATQATSAAGRPLAARTLSSTVAPAASGPKLQMKFNLHAAGLPRLGFRTNWNAIGLTYYVRAQPVTASGLPVGLPSNSVAIRVRRPVPVQVPVGPMYTQAIYPEARFVSYEPIHFQDADAQYHVVVTRDPLALPGETTRPPMFGSSPYYVGEKLDLTPHYKDSDESWWDSFCDFVGDFFSFVEEAVNWVSSSYAWIKQQAINAVGAAFGSDIQSLFSMGLDIALAYCGLPPSLPDFGQLTSMGKDYLVAEIADEAGIPKEAVSAGLDAVISQTKNVSKGSQNPTAWFVPDPDFQYKRSFVMVEVKNTSTKPTSRCELNLASVSPGYPKPFYLGGCSMVPPLTPGQKLQVPILIPENSYYKELDRGTPGEAAKLEQWYDSYANGKAYLGVYCSYAGDEMVSNATQSGASMTVKVNQSWKAQ